MSSPLLHLGDIAILRSDYDTARQHFEEALLVYRNVGNLMGQANTIIRLRAVALLQSDRDSARRRFEEALVLYEQFQNPFCVISTHLRLARIARNGNGRRQHFAAACTGKRSVQRAA